MHCKYISQYLRENDHRYIGHINKKNYIEWYKKDNQLCLVPKDGNYLQFDLDLDIKKEKEK